MARPSDPRRLNLVSSHCDVWPYPPPVLGRMLVMQLQGMESVEVAMLIFESEMRWAEASEHSTVPEQATQFSSDAGTNHQGAF